MDNDDDFTFCQVGGPVNNHGVAAQKVIQDIRGINIRDEVSNSKGSQSSSILWKDKLQNNATLQKQGTVGSLSFNVIYTSPQKQLSESPQQEASGGGGNIVRLSHGQKTPARKPTPRSKVPFEKGYSQMDWLKLTQTYPDLV